MITHYQKLKRKWSYLQIKIRCFSRSSTENYYKQWKQDQCELVKFLVTFQRSSTVVNSLEYEQQQQIQDHERDHSTERYVIYIA